MITLRVFHDPWSVIACKVTTFLPLHQISCWFCFGIITYLAE